MTLKKQKAVLTKAIFAICSILLPALAFGAIADRRASIKSLPADIPLKLTRDATLKMKSGKSTAPSKMGPKLTRALKQAKEEGPAAALQTLKAAESVSSDNRDLISVVVRPVKGADVKSLETRLISQGASIVRSGKEALKINIPFSELEKAAAFSETRTIRALAPPRKKAFEGEGVAKTFADTWHSYGFTGQGAKVAVVDGGFMSLTSLVNSGELPEDYIPVNFSSDPDIGDSDVHGSACAEIVYDIAPDAQLYLIKIDDITDLIDVSNYCITNGIDIISFSLGFDVMNFHDGIAYDNWYTGVSDHPVTAVNLANEAGVLFVVAAGNEQEQHTLINWGNSGDSLIWADNDDNLNILYDYDGSTSFDTGHTIDIFMTWNRWPVTDEDFDLYLYHYNGSSWQQVAASDNSQNGDSESYPVEEIDYTTTASGIYAVLVERYNNTATPQIILRYYNILYPYYWGYNNTEFPAPGSISIPGDAAAAFTVGAINYAAYPGGPIDSYSSLGPNNRAYTGGTAVIKPDICAPAGITSAAYGDYFSGTSAATPHIAGLAALIKGVYPYYKAQQLKAYIEVNGFDIAPVGKDNTYGSGAAQLPTSLTVIESEALKATAIAQSGGTALVSFTGIPGEQYTVKERGSLTTGTWQSIGTATVAADGTATFTDPGPLPPKRFYKLVKE